MSKLLSSLRRLPSAIAENAAIITAVSSMVIASLSLYFTVNAQRTDLEYKEISIQPRLAMMGLSENMSLSIRNVGLGPAIVKQIDMLVAGKCVTSYGKSQEEWATLHTKFGYEILPELYSKTLPPMPWKKGGKTRYNVEFNLINPGDAVRAGEDVYFVKLDEGTLKELSQVDIDDFAKAKSAFYVAAVAVPLRVEYCSATERMCGLIGPRMPQCGNVKGYD